MKVYAVTRITEVRSQNDRSYRFTWPYREAFHGKDGCVVNRYGELPYQPLPIIRNLRIMPPVCFPSIKMIVNDAIAGQLDKLNGVHLNKCVWQSVYDYPVDELAAHGLADRFSVFDDGYDKWLDRLLQAPSPEMHLPTYYELLAPSHESLQKDFLCDSVLELPPAYGEISRVHTNSLLHSRFPVTRVAPYYLFSDAAWRAMAPHVTDSDLFTVRSFDLLAEGGP